jgi:hypothetical protein
MGCPSGFRSLARQPRKELEKDMILAVHSYRNRLSYVTLGKGGCSSG